MLNYDNAIKEVDLLIKEVHNSSTMVALKKVRVLLVEEREAENEFLNINN